MVSQALTRRPNEACGALVGRMRASEYLIESTSPLTNVWPVEAERNHRFAIDPIEQLEAERHAISAGMELIGFYHSHPTSPPMPSEFDRERAWPAYLYLIVSLQHETDIRAAAWTLDEGGRFVEHAIELTGERKTRLTN